MGSKALAAAAAFVVMNGVAQAQEASDGAPPAPQAGAPFQTRLSGTATLGTMVRLAEPDPEVYGYLPASVVGATPGQLVGQTGGSDLNFAKNRPVSTVAKLTVDLELKSAAQGLFVRGTGWYDFTLGHQSAAYGNFSNGYMPGAPLSDAGQAQAARFNGAMLREAYVWQRFGVDGPSGGRASLGRQTLAWGVAQLSTGGISSALSPLDLPAQMRPGALPQEARVAMGMLDLQWQDSRQWSLELALPYESRQTVLPACGTFFDTLSIAPPGCGMATAFGAPIPGTPLNTIASLTERALLSSQFYVHRQPDVDAPAGGQYALSLHLVSEDQRRDLGFYLMDMHGFLPLYRVQVEDVGGVTLPPGLAGGLARLASPEGVKYATVYPDHIRLLGSSLSWRTREGWRFYGELTYRPNQPLSQNANDIVVAFLLRAPNSVLQLQKNVLALPPGAFYDAFDRFGVSSFSLGLNKSFELPALPGRLALGAELAGSHIAGLPDPQLMRYGRSLAYGGAPYLVNGQLTPCAVTAPGLNGVVGKTCTDDGLTTPSAWGWRLRLALPMAAGLWGAAWTPSLLVSQDVQGYAFDGSFVDGRRLARLGLRVDWAGRYFLDAQLSLFDGGRFNLMEDRSNLSLAGGAYF